jgi:hypothetical protein
MAKQTMTLRRHTIGCFVLLDIILMVTNVQSLSTTNLLSPSLKRSANSLTSLKEQTKNNIPGSELFPGKGPYVPSGLSEEEFQKVKKKEEEQLKAMNFGAWGPRFKRSDTPDGDWMVMPSLWTNGVNARARGNQLPNASSGRNPLARLAVFLKENTPAFILGYILIDVLVTALAMWRATELSMRQAMWMILKFALFKRKSFFLMTFMKTQAVKITIASAMTPVMNRFLERMNRRKLWMKRRTVVVSVGAAVGALILWAAVLRLASVLF